jgi:transcriptional regulator with XRE-family HTH domain
MGNEAEGCNFIQHKSGLTAIAFAESLGLSKAMGYQISRGLPKPSRAVLEKPFQPYHVNLHWFLTGESPSGLNPDTLEIELLEQQAAAGHGINVEDYTKINLAGCFRPYECRSEWNDEFIPPDRRRYNRNGD